MISKSVSVVVASTLMLGACSSRPRNFEPQLAAAPTDQQAYDAAWHTCREQAASSIKKGSRLGSAAAGTAAGTGAGVAIGSAAASAGSASMAGAAGAAVAGAMLITVVPVFAIAGAWGVAKIKKNKKERTIKTVTSECLAKDGYSVASWRVMSKREARALAEKPVVASATPAAAEALAKPQ